MALMFEPAYSREDHHTRPVEITEQFVLNVLNHILDDIYNNKDHTTISDAIEQAEYSIFDLRNWRSKFKDSVKIKSIYSKIKNVLENRMNKYGLQNEYSTAMVKMNLVNHYGWHDKVEQETSNKHHIEDKTADLSKLTIEQLKNYRKLRAIALNDTGTNT